MSVTVPVTRSRRRSSRQRRPLRLAAAGLVTAGLAAGCVACSSASSPAADSLIDSVGRIDGSSALIAVLARDDVVTAYLCDGPGGIAEQFTGRVRDGHADLTAPDGTTLSIELRGGASNGSVTLPGAPTAAFHTTATSRPEAGWFHTVGVEGRAPAVEASWIELDDGTQNGVCLGPATSEGGCPPGDGDTGGGTGGGDQGHGHSGGHGGGGHHGGDPGGHHHGPGGGWGGGTWGHGSTHHGRPSPCLRHRAGAQSGERRGAVEADADFGGGHVVGASRVRI